MNCNSWQVVVTIPFCRCGVKVEFSKHSGCIERGIAQSRPQGLACRCRAYRTGRATATLDRVRARRQGAANPQKESLRDPCWRPPAPPRATSGMGQLGHMLGVDFERHAEAEDFAWPGVELVGDGVEVGRRLAWPWRSNEMRSVRRLPRGST